MIFCDDTDAYHLDYTMRIVYFCFVVALKCKLLVLFALLIGYLSVDYDGGGENDIVVYVYRSYTMFKMLNKEYIDSTKPLSDTLYIERVPR